MALTEIEDGMITDGILTTSKLNTTGTASATTVLKGDFSWATGASTTGKWSIVDSAPGSPVAGDMWYAGGVIYIAIATANTTGVWSTANSLPVALHYNVGAGTQTAGLSVGGFSAALGARQKLTFEYNGLTWSAGSNLTYARDVAGGFGIQTAAAVCGGYTGSGDMNSTEEYDGTSWSAGGSLNNARRELSATGTQSLGLCQGGYDSALCEKYDGSSWSNTGSLSINRYGSGAAGTQSAAACFGGMRVSGGSLELTSTEEFGGSSWSSGGSMRTGRHYLGGCGTQTAAVSFGGYTSVSVPSETGASVYYSKDTEEYDGTSWSGGGNLSIATNQLGGCGTQSAALGFGGYTYVAIASTEEYNRGGLFNPKGVGYA